MNLDFSFPVILVPEERDGGFVVTLPDFPEAITQGEDRADALVQAGDALEEAVAGRMRRGEPIPGPSVPAEGQPTVPVPALTAAKAALYLAMREEGIRKSELAERLRCDEKEVRRLLDPRHPSKLGRLQEALAAMGQTLSIRVLGQAA